ncbi:MAG TPA: hypothetical protein VLA43_01100, partial [Longimicrobiales bacterium]|nr:hypothetical protein [Longimicrobiales bacterium]
QLPDALPGILVQWRAQSPGGSVPLRLTAVLLPPTDAPAAGSATLRFHAAPGLLWVARGDAGVLLCVPGAGAVPEIRTRDGEILLDWDLSFGSPGAPLTLLLQAAPPEGVWPALAALAGATAHHRRGEAASLGDGEPGVTLEAGVEEMDSGVRWIRAWTRDRLLTVPGVAPGMHGPPASSRSGAGGLSDDPVVHLPGEAAGWLLPGSEAAWLVMGSAVSGDWEAGRAALSGLGWDSPRVALLSALALARWTAWTGEARPLVEHGPQLAAVLAPHGLPDGVEPEVVTEIRRAVMAAAEAAEATGAAMSVLRESGEPPATRNAPGTPGGGRRLPVVGARAGAVPPLVLRPGREGVPVEVRLREALEVR